MLLLGLKLELVGVYLYIARLGAATSLDPLHP